MVFKRFLADRQQSKDLQLKEDKGLKGTKKNIDELMNEKERFKEIKQYLDNEKKLDAHTQKLYGKELKEDVEHIIQSNSILKVKEDLEKYLEDRDVCNKIMMNHDYILK